MKIGTLSSALCFVLWTLPASADVLVRWEPSMGGNGHWYQLVRNDSLDFNIANDSANSMSYLGVSGHLATIANQAEQDFIYNSFKDSLLPGYAPFSAWIGLTDNEAFGGQESSVYTNNGAPYWVWVTGEPVTYVNWLTANGSYPANEPNNFGGSEDFVELVFDGRGATHGGWNDADGNVLGLDHYYIVEYDVVPEPMSLLLALAAFGLLGVACCQRRRPSPDMESRRFLCVLS